MCRYKILCYSSPSIICARLNMQQSSFSFSFMSFVSFSLNILLLKEMGMLTVGGRFVSDPNKGIVRFGNGTKRSMLHSHEFVQSHIGERRLPHMPYKPEPKP